jgi:hypothetical protein
MAELAGMIVLVPGERVILSKKRSSGSGGTNKEAVHVRYPTDGISH